MIRAPPLTADTRQPEAPTLHISIKQVLSPCADLIYSFHLEITEIFLVSVLKALKYSGNLKAESQRGSQKYSVYTLILI